MPRGLSVEPFDIASATLEQRGEIDGPFEPEPRRPGAVGGEVDSYLPDDILCEVDRASMAVNLETRVPFLDHRVAQLAARIPLAQKIADGTGKLVLRQLLYAHAPKALFERPKAGFAIPVGEWIKGPTAAVGRGAAPTASGWPRTACSIRRSSGGAGATISAAGANRRRRCGRS